MQRPAARKMKIQIKEAAMSTLIAQLQSVSMLHANAKTWRILKYMAEPKIPFGNMLQWPCASCNAKPVRVIKLNCGKWVPTQAVKQPQHGELQPLRNTTNAPPFKQIKTDLVKSWR